MDKISIAYILLGGNIEPRKKYLEYAENHININIGKVIKTSSIYETEAWGFETQKAFLNKLLKIETSFGAEKLLNELLNLELQNGRKRMSGGGYSSRTLDADILYFNDEIINSDNLIVPHPRLHLRKFVLEPLNEIATDFIHPLLKLTSSELLSNCKDKSIVKKLDEL